MLGGVGLLVLFRRESVVVGDVAVDAVPAVGGLGADAAPVAALVPLADPRLLLLVWRLLGHQVLGGAPASLYLYLVALARHVLPRSLGRRLGQLVAVASLHRLLFDLRRKGQGQFFRLLKGSCGNFTSWA